MARKNIQGITIEIGGDTTKLQDALRGVENKLKDTQAALKDVNKLLKLDPGNTELLTQKQKLLTESIQGTEEKLKVLKDASEQAAAAMASGDEKAAREYDTLQREIIETEQNLKSMKKEMKDFGSVAAQQLKAAGEKVKDFGDKVTKAGENMTKYVTGPIVAVGAASVAAFNEVDESMDILVKKTGATGAALEDMEDRVKNLATSIPTDFRTAGEAIGEVNTRFNLTGDALEDLSAKFIKFAELNETDVTSSIDTVQSAMAAFGLDASYAGNVLDILNKAAQDTGVDVNKLSGDLAANAAAFQEMGFRIAGAAGFLANLDKQGLDTSTVLTGLKKALQNATKNGQSMDTALKSLTSKIKNAKSETKAMQIATELFGSKAAPAMVKAIRDGRLSFDELSNAVKQTSGSVENTFEETLDPIDEFKTALNELKIVGMELVEAAAPMIKQLADMLKDVFTRLREWWEGLSPLTQETIIKAAAIAAAIGPVLAVVGKLIGLISGLMNPIGLVIAAVGALAAGFVYLWNKSDGFREFWKNLWPNIKETAVKAGEAISDFLSNTWENITGTAERLWNGLRDGLSTIWDGIKQKASDIWAGITDTIHNAIEKIKSFFKFEWELPKIKLPHFSIQGDFSIVPPRVPTISVDWYKKAMQDGMILNSPTIFGAANGRLLGGGEAGSEAVVGVDSLRQMIQSAVAGTNGNQPRMMTVILQLKEQELARTVYQLNNAEVQRVGVRLSTARG